MGPICTWLFLYSEYLFILDSTEYERFLPMSWILEFLLSICCVYIYICSAGFVEHLLYCSVVSTSMRGVSHAVQNEKKL